MFWPNNKRGPLKSIICQRRRCLVRTPNMMFEICWWPYEIVNSWTHFSTREEGMELQISSLKSFFAKNYLKSVKCPISEVVIICGYRYELQINVPIIKIPNIWGRIKMWTCVDNFLSEKKKKRTYCQYQISNFK